MIKAVLLAFVCVLAFARERPPEAKAPITFEVVGQVYKPVRLDATASRIRQLKAPTGFRITKFADGLENPRMLAVAADGTVYVTEPRPGRVMMLRDTDGDGSADEKRIATQQQQAHGIAVRGTRVYIATVKEVLVAERKPDGALSEPRKLIGNLPDGGQHPNRTLAFGPDGMLYISIGSTCNACDETNPEHATMLRVKLDGSGREVFARGLRNTLGFAWHPQTGQLYGMDQGIDWLGSDEQVEELNLLVQGGHYGWPKVYGRNKLNPSELEANGEAANGPAKTARGPVLGYAAHSSPMQMVFYTADQFPPEYRNDAFVAMRGSWNRRPPSGYEVVRVRFSGGKPAGIEPFLTGFLVQTDGGDWAHFGRPVGLGVLKDGSLLLSDDTNGVIYRVSYGR